MNYREKYGNQELKMERENINSLLNKENYPLHESMRGFFGYELYKAMAKDESIFLISADLGYGLFNEHRIAFPERFLNTGAAEASAVGIAVGLAESGKIPIFYSITNFALYRPFETIRNYIDHEQIPVKIIGGGRDKSYLHDGYSHWSEDAKMILDASFPNVTQYWPEEKEEMAEVVEEILYNGKPTFLSLKRE